MRMCAQCAAGGPHLAHKLIGRGVAGHEVVGGPAQAGVRAAHRASALMALQCVYDTFSSAQSWVSTNEHHVLPMHASNNHKGDVGRACLRELEYAPSHHRHRYAD